MRALLRGALSIGCEALRLLLKRPVFGVMTVPIDSAGRVVLQLRRDSGTWCLPGGMAEWGERVGDTLTRELKEETGHRVVRLGRLVGVFSDPARDPRMHSIVVVIEAEVAPDGGAVNPLETAGVAAFSPDALPAPLAFDTAHILEVWRAGGAAVID
jgi:ADP-ribose pyrophosphatase YjhB (NUDIX family)